MKRLRPVLTAVCDRDDALDRQGEKVVFKVLSQAVGEATYRLSEGGFKTIKEGKRTLVKSKAAELTGNLDRPGFLRLRVTLGKNSALAAAGWDEDKKELARMPSDARTPQGEPNHG